MREPAGEVMEFLGISLVGAQGFGRPRGWGVGAGTWSQHLSAPRSEERAARSPPAGRREDAGGWIYLSPGNPPVLW